MRVALTNLLAVAGGLVFAAGVALIWVPAGLIALGALMVAGAWLAQQ